MNEHELWLSFIKSGSVKDYLSYLEEKEREVKQSEDKDTSTRNPREEYRG